MVSIYANLLEQKKTGLVWNINMAAISLFWNTNTAAVRSCENLCSIPFDLEVNPKDNFLGGYHKN